MRLWWPWVTSKDHFNYVPYFVKMSKWRCRSLILNANKKGVLSQRWPHDARYTLWGIKNCTLLTGTITWQNYAILWLFLAYRCTWEYPITCLFDSLCKIKNWEPAYQICYCLLSSRQQRKMWNSCCNARSQTSLLQTYGLLTVLTLILWITDIWSTAVTCLLEIC